MTLARRIIDAGRREMVATTTYCRGVTIDSPASHDGYPRSQDMRGNLRACPVCSSEPGTRKSMRPYMLSSWFLPAGAD